jgi:hypothetical protein
MDIIPAAIKNFLDAIFLPPITFLNMINEYLSSISLIAGKGINLNQYLGFFSYLPGSLQSVINSLLASILFIALLQLVVVIMRMYYAIKEAVKWW